MGAWCVRGATSKAACGVTVTRAAAQACRAAAGCGAGQTRERGSAAASCAVAGGRRRAAAARDGRGHPVTASAQRARASHRWERALLMLVVTPRRGRELVVAELHCAVERRGGRRPGWKGLRRLQPRDRVVGAIDVRLSCSILNSSTRSDWTQICARPARSVDHILSAAAAGGVS